MLQTKLLIIEHLENKRKENLAYRLINNFLENKASLITSKKLFLKKQCHLYTQFGELVLRASVQNISFELGLQKKVICIVSSVS